MEKTMILPVISVICLGVASFTGHAISQGIQQQLADGIYILIGAGVSIWGIFKNHKGGQTK